MRGNMELTESKETQLDISNDRVNGPFDAVIAQYKRACYKQYARDRRLKRDFQTKNELAALNFYQATLSKLAGLNQ